MKASDLIAHINRERGTSYRITGRYAQGESGAARRVADAHGNRFVLKFGASTNVKVRDAHPGRTTARLRSLGYPAPEYVAVGIAGETWYALQTAMPGEPNGARVSLALLPQLLHLNDLQRGQGEPANDEPEHLIRGVMEGYAEFCVIDTLRTYSADSAAMLDSLQRIVIAHAHECPKRNDIVHFDFHTNNVLIDEDQITGVIDWEGSESGDCAFDLATMLFYTWPFADFRKDLSRELMKRTTRGAMAVYLAHMIVRQLDWSMRHHPREVAERYMGISHDILRTIEHL
jgi:thiamine kinase-like enzyme